MNKTLACFLLLAAPLFTFADDVNYVNMTNTQIQQHLYELAQKNQDAYQTNLTQSLDEAAAKNQAAVEAAIKQSQEKEKPQKPKAKKIEKCNCYSSSAYNFPANFRYNEKNIRVERIQPACECILKDTPAYLKELASNSPTAPLDSANTDNTSDSNTQNSAPDTTSLTNNSSADTSSSNDSNNNDNFGINYN